MYHNNDKKARGKPAGGRKGGGGRKGPKKPKNKYK